MCSLSYPFSLLGFSTKPCSVLLFSEQSSIFFQFIYMLLAHNSWVTYAWSCVYYAVVINIANVFCLLLFLGHKGLQRVRKMCYPLSCFKHSVRFYLNSFCRENKDNQLLVLWLMLFSRSFWYYWHVCCNNWIKNVSN